MVCERCEGFMVHEEQDGIQDHQRCVNCGERLDSIIETNRSLPVILTAQQKGLARPPRDKMIRRPPVSK